jgi:hypothetical protein
VPNYNVKSVNSDKVAFQVFNNFFPEEYLKIFYEYNKTQTWGLDRVIDGPYTDLIDPFFEKDCVDVINKKIGITHELYRCHRNAYYPTTLSKSHYDTHHKADRTFIWYGHEHWNISWGGETTVGENDDYYVKPIPNSALYFSSKHHKHNVRPISFGAEIPRITYIWLLSSR